MKTFTLAIVMLLALCAGGCKKDLTRADQRAYALEASVTRVDNAVLAYTALTNCQLTGDLQPCSKTSAVKRLAEATTKLGKAMDAYNTSIQASGGVADQGIRADVLAALAAVNQILIDLGLGVAGVPQS